MTKIKFSIILFLSMELFSQTSNLYISAGGPPFNFARDFIFHSDTLYMIDYQGEIFMSSDTGKSWRSYYRKDGITSFAINSTNEQFITTFYGGVLYSSNQGASWEKRTTGFPSDIQYSALHATIDNRLFCSTTKGLYISSNSGVSWHLFAHSNRNVTLTIVDHRGYIYCNASGFYWSTNNGSTWNSYAETLNKILVGNDTLLFRLSNKKIYKSPDGITWQKIWELNMQGKLILDIENFSYDKLIVSLSDGNNLILASAGTLLDSFSVTQNGSKIYFEPIFNLKSAKKIIAGTGYSIAVSTDSIIAWSFYSSGLTKSNVVCLESIDSLIFAYNNGYGLFKFNFINSNWSETNFQRKLIIKQLTYDKHGMLYALCDSSLYRTNDLGATWDKIIDASLNLKLQKFELHGVDTLLLFTSNNSLLLSSNRGLQWEVINLKPSPQSTVNEFKSLSSSYFIILSDGKIFKSTNTAQNWQLVIPNSFGFTKIYLLKNLLLATNFDDLYYSDDTAKTWQRSNTIFPIGTNIRDIICNSVGQFYIASTNGIFRSLDSAKNWVDHSLDLLNKKISSITFGPEEILFVGTEFDGLFRTLHSTTQVKENIGQHPQNYLLYQNYPNPFNPSTVIKYAVGSGSKQLVTLKVFDILGNEVATLVNEEKESGVYNYQFSILNSQFPSGVYFYQLRVGDFTETKKMILLQ